MSWMPGSKPTPGEPYRAISHSDETTVLEAADAQPVGVLSTRLNLRRQGLLKVTAVGAGDVVELDYLGPSDLLA